MRQELQLFEQIDRYARAAMSSDERNQFEVQLASNPQLQASVQQHIMLLQAIRRKALLTRIESLAPKTSTANMLWTRFKWPIILSAVAIALISLALVVTHNESAKKASVRNSTTSSRPIPASPATGTSIPSENTISTRYSGRSSARMAERIQHRKNIGGLQTWVPAEVQQFTIQSDQTTILEGKEGTLVVIPAHSVLNSAGNPVSGALTIELVEALTMDKMIAYNLTTVAGKDVLSSEGMIFLQPNQHGEPLHFSKENPAHVEIPTAAYNPEMQLWRGATDTQGNINWTEPTPLENYLIRVQFDQLDFTPANFRSTFRGMLPFENFRTSSLELEDSVYFSLNTLPTEEAVSAPSQPREIPINVSPHSQGRRRQKNKVLDSPVFIGSNFQITSTPSCAIDPGSVKAIRSTKFSETYLATKEFEERLHVLFGLPDAQAAFDAYVRNCRGNLYESDSLVAQCFTGESQKRFMDFAKLRHTNVRKPMKDSETLFNYYNEQRKAYRQTNQQNAEELVRKDLDELAALKKKYALIDRESPFETSVSYATTASYKFSWFGSGWANIDAYLKELTGKTHIVTVKSDPMPGTRQVYQCINSLQTVVSLNTDERGHYQATYPWSKAPTASKYAQSYCFGIAHTENGLYFAHTPYETYSTDSISLQWKPIQEVELIERIRSLGNISEQSISSFENQRKKQLIQIEQAMVEQRQAEAWRREYDSLTSVIAARHRFYGQLMESINPCSSQGGIAASPLQAIFPLSEPVFSGGTVAMNNYFAENTRYPQEAIDRGISGKVWVQFEIDASGYPQNIVPVRRSPNTALLEEEAVRLVREMPPWTVDGAQSASSFPITLPITFSLN